MTAPPDLPAFLLARAADRERQAPDIHEATCAAVAYTEWGGEGYFADSCDCGEPARVLAECAAKRAIVERFKFVDSHGPAVDHVRALDMTTGAQAALLDVLRLLAQAFADHPAFDESWRV